MCEIPSIDNGAVFLEEGILNARGSYHVVPGDTIITVECNTGYTYNAAMDKSICSKRGWFPKLGHCEEEKSESRRNVIHPDTALVPMSEKCLVPPVVNGNIQVLDDVYARTEVLKWTPVIISCNPGFATNTTVSVCEGDNVWMPLIRHCTRMDHQQKSILSQQEPPKIAVKPPPPQPPPPPPPPLPPPRRVMEPPRSRVVEQYVDEDLDPQMFSFNIYERHPKSNCHGDHLMQGFSPASIEYCEDICNMHEECAGFAFDVDPLYHPENYCQLKRYPLSCYISDRQYVSFFHRKRKRKP